MVCLCFPYVSVIVATLYSNTTYSLLTFCFSSSSSSSDFETELMYIPMNDSDSHSSRTEKDKCYSRYGANSKYKFTISVTH